MFDFSVVTDTVLAQGGQPVTIHAESGDMDLQAVHSAPSLQRLRPDRGPYREMDHKLFCRSAEFVATGAIEGDGVLVSGVEYFITDIISEDDSGSTTLLIRPA